MSGLPCTELYPHFVLDQSTLAACDGRASWVQTSCLEVGQGLEEHAARKLHLQHAMGVLLKARPVAGNFLKGSQAPRTCKSNAAEDL